MRPLYRRPHRSSRSPYVAALRATASLHATRVPRRCACARRQARGAVLRVRGLTLAGVVVGSVAVGPELLGDLAALLARADAAADARVCAEIPADRPVAPPVGGDSTRAAG